MAKVEVKFGDWIQKGFDLYKANLGVLILSGLVMVLLSAITFGILGGPLAAGMILIVFRLMDRSEPKPQVGDLFKGFAHFGQTFLFFLVWGLICFAASFILGLIPCVGSLVAMAGIYALQAGLMFGMYLIVDRKMDFWPASMTSIQKVKENFFPFLGFFLVAGIIGGIGAIACGIGVVATLPITFCCLSVAYREVFGPEAPAAATAAPAAPETPAAPAPQG